MVSSVQSTVHAPLSPLQTQPRSPQASNENVLARDAVSISRAADLGAAHESLSDARTAMDLALAAGREGAGLLSQMRDLARAALGADDAGRTELDKSFQALLARYGEVVNGATDAGAELIAGGSISVVLGSESAPITIAGYDLRLKDNPGAEDALRVSLSSNLRDETAASAAARDADASLARVDTALGRLSAAGLRLSAHDQFLSTLDGAMAANINEPADAEGARLMALQVRQALLGENAAIANSAPQALLTLFRE